MLRPESVATMFQPHFQPDPRVPGMGLAFELGEEGGQRTVSKTGIVSGFHSAMALAPDKGIGVVAFSNTGGLDGRNATEPLAATLLRRLLGLPANVLRTDIPPRPETWSEICGWYSPTPGPVTNLFPRALMGAGAEVIVEGGHLTLKPLTPIPAMRHGFRLYPDDPDDPWVFRSPLPRFRDRPPRGVRPRTQGGGGQAHVPGQDVVREAARPPQSTNVADRPASCGCGGAGGPQRTAPSLGRAAAVTWTGS